MIESTSAHYSSKIKILSELWLGYREDEQFGDFVEYNDIGLPLAYMLDNDIVKSTPMAERFINETYDLLITALGLVDDKTYESVDDMLDDYESTQESE